uniref:Protein kinase domain-containing protein n=1 Tax=Trypanosoma congolense (strain IL3000) TaxID=1068625 RepID=G0UJY6_TRYCI|nr:putative protein kinase [Trypanosoma congolense IL3000]
MENIRRTSRKLGVGAMGVVYEGYDEESGRFVAVKEIPVYDVDVSAQEDSCVAGGLRSILHEISLMERLAHPNLVTYYGARRSAAGVEIIMEYVNGGSLDSLIRRQGCLRESVVRSYARDLLEGLSYLHNTARICHRDVKPANVLITADGRCKLTDFGVSKLLDDTVGMHTTVGTPWYMAPEVVDCSGNTTNTTSSIHGCVDGADNDNIEASKLGSSYTTAADVWSFGVTVYEMITGKKPFGGNLKNAAAVLFSIVSNSTPTPRLPSTCDASPLLQDFLDLCFVRDPTLRPSARELLSHMWFHEASSPRHEKRLEGSTSCPSQGDSAAARSLSTTRPVDMDGNTSSETIVTTTNALVAYPPALHLNMMDIADILTHAAQENGQLVTSASSPNKSRADHIKRANTGEASSAMEGFQGGFWSPEGHFIDLFMPQPPCRGEPKLTQGTPAAK